MSRHSRKRRRLPAEPVELQIESLAHDGRGVARVEGKTVFVHGALRGERVRARYLARYRQYDVTQCEAVLEAASERVEPRCAHYGQCGGCSLQHMAPGAQIAAKQAILLQQLEKIGRVTPAQVFEPLTAATWGYRRKARLGVRDVPRKGRVLVGFRERNSSFIADLGRCEILDEAIGGRLTDLARLIEGLSIRQRTAQIEVAVGDNGGALVFRNLDQPNGEDCDRLRAFGEATDLQIYLQPAGPDHLVPLWPESPELWYQLPDFDLRLRFRPTDFTQVNSGINRQMVTRAIELLDVGPGDRVLDLFCGLGNFTLPLARRAGLVVGVEGDPGLIERARANARANDIDNAEFHSADLASSLADAPWLGEAYDRLLFDPPRSGALEVLPHIPRIGARRIVYISCNPATLARDAGELVRNHGYRLAGAGAMDMFPHTGHVESIALFEKE